MKWITLLAALLLGSSASAADGDFVSFNQGGSNSHYFVAETLLCDGDHSSDATCAEIDLLDVATTSDGRVPVGFPKYITIDIRDTDGATCTSDSSLAVVGRTTAGASVEYDLISGMTAGGVASATLTQLSHRYIAGVITTNGDCTTYEVVVRSYYRRFHEP
jgi:hypothetical protein